MKLMSCSKKKLIIIVLIGLILAIGYFWEEGEEFSHEDDYRYRVGDPQIRSYEAGELRWNIVGSELKETNNDSAKMILEDITKAELLSQQRTVYEIFAEQGVFYRDSEDLDLLNNVILRDRFDDEIKTDELFYSNEEHQLTTESGVEVIMDEANILAPKMIIDIEQDIIDFSGGVEMNFEIKGEN